MDSHFQAVSQNAVKKLRMLACLCQNILQNISHWKNYVNVAGLVNQLCSVHLPSQKGLPYRYLQTVRISRAKELLEQGVSTIDTAVQTGFSDQSHFSSFFHMFIGLSPAAYRRIFKEGGRNHG